VARPQVFVERLTGIRTSALANEDIRHTKPLYSLEVVLYTTRFNLENFYVLPTKCLYVFCMYV